MLTLHAHTHTQSYFAGNQAGSDEILKLACSILGMHKDQRRAIEIGARKFKQGGVLNRGFFGLLSAPAATWESITEAEIGKDWVQFLIGIF